MNKYASFQSLCQYICCKFMYSSATPGEILPLLTNVPGRAKEQGLQKGGWRGLWGEGGGGGGCGGCVPLVKQHWSCYRQKLTDLTKIDCPCALGGEGSQMPSKAAFAL